jgi:hypothetical protein
LLCPYGYLQLQLFFLFNGHQCLLNHFSRGSTRKRPLPARRK